MSHERDLMAGRPVFLGLGALVVLLVLAWAVPTWLEHDLLERRESRFPPTNPLAEQYGRTVPPVPRLQVNPDRDIESYRAAQTARLGGYGWVDRESGIVHIPIERAMEIVAAREAGNDAGGAR